MTMNIAAIARTIHGNLSRNQLKVLRAKLRRAGLTNVDTGATASGAYTIAVTSDVVADARTIDGGNALVAAIAIAA